MPTDVGELVGTLALARKAVAMQPHSTQYRVNLVRMLIAAGENDAAQREIAELRATGRAGRHEHDARVLEERLRTWGNDRR